MRKGELFWGALAIAFFYYTAHNYDALKDLALKEFNQLPPVFFAMLIPALLGIITGIPSLIDRWSDKQSFNWSRLIFQGLPAFLITTSYDVLLSYTGLNIDLKYMPWIPLQSLGPDGFVFYIASFWFGRTLVSCLKGQKISKMQI